jgi:MFS superfamily sulfate permease-like transporter
VALPLCLGIALASNAPLFSGIIAGIVGGIVIGSISGSQLSVCGPAAGLTTIVIASQQKLGSWEVFLSALVIAGVIQFVLGLVRAGSIGNYFPSSVIKGMLAAIGLILILKQIPHAVGYDADFEGDEAFVQPDGRNTLTEILNAFDYISPGAVGIALVSLLLLILWEQPFIRRQKFALFLPGPLVAVVVGTLMNQLYLAWIPNVALAQSHLVSLPVASSGSEFIAQFSFPNFEQLLSPTVWEVAVTLALVASIETLLSIEAIDKLDPYKRISPLNLDLKAQGIGNIAAGGRTKASAIFHGVLLLVTVVLIPRLLNMIPLSCLAAILLTVGYKLTKPSVIKEMFTKGWQQFLPFAITIIAILLTDLLKGITVGIVIGLLFILKTNFHRSLFKVSMDGNYLIRLTRDVSFLNKAVLRRALLEIPDNSYVIIDGSRSTFIDYDIQETISDFQKGASSRGITVELAKSMSASNNYFRS